MIRETFVRSTECSSPSRVTSPAEATSADFDLDVNATAGPARGTRPELDTAATQLPARLDPLRRDLAKLQGMLDSERAKLTETETWRKTQQDQLDKEREAQRRAALRSEQQALDEVALRNWPSMANAKEI